MICLSSCYEDKGNYEYAENESIIIEGIEGEYERTYLQQNLTITPTVTPSDKNAKMSYLWYIRNSSSNGDTISNTLNFDILVDINPTKTHTIRFEAKNLNTGYTCYKEFTLVINTPFSTGWYVLKNNGDYSDLDLYSIEQKKRVEDVIKYVNGRHLKGSSDKLSFFNSFYNFSEFDNKYVKMSVLFARTNSDIACISLTDGKIIRDHELLYFEVPEKSAPSFIGESVQVRCIINDGVAHTLGTSSQNNSQFTVPKYGYNNADYFLSKFGYTDYMMPEILVFDELSSTFFLCNDASNFLLPIADIAGTELSCIKTDCKLVYMGTKEKMKGKNLYAVLENKSDPTIKMFANINTSNIRKKTLSMAVETINSTDKAYNGEFFSMSLTEDVIYFISEGALWARNVSAKGSKEILQYTLPAGEKATFVKSINYSETDGVQFNYVILGTSNGTNYKVKFFNKTSAGNINPEPAFTLPSEKDEAAGIATDILYISPKLNIFSYIYE